MRNCLVLVFIVYCRLAQAAASPSAGSGQDWPQLQHDAARTGWTPDSPAPPFELEYVADFNPELLGQVQPIVYNGVMYIPSLEGRLFALEPRTGERLWVAEGFGVVLRTPAAADNLVFMAAADGKLRAASAADGKPVWETDLGFGVSASPCVLDGRIYIGARNGEFFCLETKTGKIVWRTSLEFYVWSSAAASDGKVYVCTDGEIRVHCLDAATGRVLWRSDKLPGIYMREWCPVLTAGRVFVRTQPAESISDEYETVAPPYHIWGPQTREDFMKYYQDLGEGRLPQDFEQANDTFIAFLDENPTRQTMFVFDAKTGARTYTAGAFHNLSGWSSPCPPSAVDSEGMLQVSVPYGMSRFGRLDPATGRVIQILVGPVANTDGAIADGFGTNSDENHASSCGGRRIYWKHHGMGGCDSSMVYDLETQQAVRLEWYMPRFTGPRLRVGMSSRRPMRPGTGDLTDNSLRGSNTAMAIWGDFMFHQAQNQVFAIRGAGKSEQGGGK